MIMSIIIGIMVGAIFTLIGMCLYDTNPNRRLYIIIIGAGIAALVLFLLNTIIYLILL